ncbi:MAG: hypothetical protein HEQ27_04850 [Dolichospermum sp. JUN01]|nr:hypothetical protein [Dolichospermum sp. JUN01]
MQLQVQLIRGEDSTFVNAYLVELALWFILSTVYGVLITKAVRVSNESARI